MKWHTWFLTGLVGVALLPGCSTVATSSGPGVRSDTREADVTLSLEDLLRIADTAEQSGQLPKVGDETVDPGQVFWQGVLDRAGGTSPALAAAAQQRLARVGSPVDPFTAGLLAAGKGQATFADGTTVDWTPGKPTGAPRARVEVALAEGGGDVTAGTPLRLTVRVRNEGRGPLYQFRATTRSSLRSADRALILFGKVEPGTTVTRHVELPTAITMPTGDVTVTLQFKELNDYAPASIESRFIVRAAARPRLDIWVRAVDDGSGQSVGNGDGVIQRGEAIDFYIAVKNVGAAPAERTTLSLQIPSLKGIEVFGEAERALGTLAPGEVRESVFNLSVKPTYPDLTVPISAQVIEQSPFQVRLHRDVSVAIDERAPQQIIALNQTVVALKPTTLLNAASADARPLGTVEASSRLQAVGELGNFVKIEYADKSGNKQTAWLTRRDLSFDLAGAPSPPAAAGGLGGAVVTQYAYSPPTVAFLTPMEGKANQTAEGDIEVRATIKDQQGLTAVRLLVNGHPLAALPDLLRGVQVGPAASAGAAEPSLTVVNVNRRVPLQAGENRIAIEASNLGGKTDKAEVVVVRAVREPNVLALVIGIDQYEDPAISPLKYAEADARAFADFLRGPHSPVKNPANVKLITGKEATTRALRTALSRHLVAQATQPEDMVIFYFAGHGFSDGDRYFLAGANTELEDVRATSLRHTELQEFWNDIKADRKIFVADACHSGGLQGLRGDNMISTGMLRAVEASEAEKGKGKIAILASRDKQQSLELDDLGHGIFTWTLLEGLNGKADKEVGNQDGRVSVRELVAYLDRWVPALAKKKGHSQNPMYEIAAGEGDIQLTR